MEKHRYGFDITELAKRWADGVASPAKGIVLSAPAIESGSNCWYKTFASYNRSSNKPSLSIQYETKMVCNIRNTASGNNYLQATTTSTISFMPTSIENIEDNGTYLWSIEYYPQYDSFHIVSMGQRYLNGTGSYALLCAGSTTCLVQQGTGNPYIRFNPIRYYLKEGYGYDVYDKDRIWLE